MIIGYTSGVFDLFHIGHLNILRRAKAQCDKLIVGVSTDELVAEYKNKKPIIPFEQRKAIVAAIRYVDEVVTQESMDKMAAWENLHFDVMFHGDEWKGSELYNKYEMEFAKVDAKIIYLPHTDGICSTDITKKIDENHG
ncbi:MAG: adenylyltransferase/cytidyltransferase family protein [Rikenellaceae bacterium]